MSSCYRLTAAVISLALLALTACEQREPQPSKTQASPSASSARTPSSNPGDGAARIEADLRKLADDAMQGREAGTAGYDKAAEYVAQRMRALGLQPAGANGSYFQQVPLLKAKRQQAGARLAVLHPGRNVELRFKDQFLPAPNYHTPLSEVTAPAVFIGYGVFAPQFDHDDFSGQDLKGKIAVLFTGAPACLGHGPRAVHGDTAEKLRLLVAHGAVGAVFVYTAQDEARYAWSRIANAWDKPSMRLRGADGKAIDSFAQLKVVASVSAAAADTLFQGSGRFAAELAKQAQSSDFKGFALPVQLALAARTQVEPIYSRNVLGRLPGRDASLAAEHLVYSAHLDHVGVGAPVKGDSIYNGAMDNALGVAILLEVARELSAAKPAPKRSLVFAAVTAEEQGLLGARWLVAQPTLSGPIVANINLDMPVLLAPSTDVIAIGVDHSSLKRAVDSAAKTIGVDLSPDPFPEEAVFVRSDQYPFIRAGIPALYLVGGTVSADGERDPKRALTQFLREHYHKPSDQADLPIVYGDAARLARLSARIGALVSNEAQRPEWNPGDFFGERFAKTASAEKTAQ